jgi:hypothetical protein
MSTARTFVTIDATALGEFLENLAVSAEARAAGSTEFGWSEGYSEGCATVYRGILSELQREIEKGAGNGWLLPAMSERINNVIGLVGA